MEEFLHSKNKELIQKLETDPEKGLKTDQVKERLLKDGYNELKKAKSRNWCTIFILALIKPIQLMLIAAAVISVITSLVSENWKVSGETFIDFVVIMAIVAIDAILETAQEMKARKSMEALKSLSQPKTIVIRDGGQKEIPARELVIGDIVVLEAGKYIPAELRIIESQDLMIDESILTGESIPVEKIDTPLEVTTNILAEMKNIAFNSTFTTAGRGIGVVIKIAKDSEIGKIAEAISENEDPLTPLEKKINKFSMWVALSSLLIGATIFGSLMAVAGTVSLWSDYLMVAITLAIGIIPESLSAVISITLSLSTKRMAAKNVIVKKLASVETLGSVNVICTDKTGTLTQNKMTVKTVIVDNKIVSSADFLVEGTDEHKDLFLKALVLPNDSVTEGTERIGDPTELALVDYADLMGYDEQVSRQKWKRIDEIPFDSDRKLMTTVNEIEGVQHTFTKGAIDQILKCCDEILIDNKIKKLTPEYCDEILMCAEKLSTQSLRVLAFAYNTDYAIEPDKDDLEKNLIFIGAVGMIDPVRDTAVQAVQEAHAAGIRVIMITGDHAITALAIGKDLGLAENATQVLSSDQLNDMSDEQLIEKINDINVFARVNPEHKVRIVKALQSKDYVVSMTGDGVNDAPSLSKADVGVAMGITGTDVAKDAADVILTDDNFHTIIAGVYEGRNVFKKIQRALTFVMGVNISNVLTIFILSLICHISPLEATNILWMNLIVESILAITLGMGPNDKTLMSLKPKSSKVNLFVGTWTSLIKITIILSIFSISAFFVGQLFAQEDWFEKVRMKETPLDEKMTLIAPGRTSVFLVITTSPVGVVNFIKLSNWKTTRKIQWLVNKPLLMASIGAGCANVILLFIPTLNTAIFDLVDISFWSQTTNGMGNYLLFVFAACLILGANIVILSLDFIIFASYHYLNKTNKDIKKRSIKI